MPAFIVFLLAFTFQAQAYKLEFAGDFVLSTQMKGSKTPVGGLSDLTFLKNNEVLAVSDDRGRRGPERFYKLSLTPPPKLKFTVTEEITLEKKGSFNLDPEGIVIAPDGHVFISSEGDRKFIGRSKPGIFAYDLAGKVLAEFPLSKIFWDGSKGFRNNRGFESLAISADKKQLFAANEGNLRQDPENLLRIVHYDVEKKKEIAQWPYPFEAADYKKGLVALLHMGGQKFIAMERGYIPPQTILAQLYEVDCSKAENVSKVKSLKGEKAATCSKKMIFDLKKIEKKLKTHDQIDNLEGLALGPKNPEGWRWLLLVADNNFKDKQRNQFLAFKFRAD